MGIGAKIGERPQIADSPEIRKRAQCPLRVGINLTEPIMAARWPMRQEGQLPVRQPVADEVENPIRHLHLLPRSHSGSYRERPQDK